MCALLCQCVMITDPVLATQVLRSKVVDKLRFQYSFLDPVRILQQTPPCRLGEEPCIYSASRSPSSPAWSARGACPARS